VILNKDITVINEYNGIFYGFFIPGVSFIGKTERTATEKGLNTADYFTCRIPENAPQGEYLTPYEWKSLSSAPTDKWALIPQKTMIAFGSVTNAELNNVNSLVTREVYRVTSVKDNRVGFPALRHWRFDCK
jgi:uracil-DNA glycosylase